MQILREQLKRVRKVSAPSEEFEKLLWAELEDAFEHEYPSLTRRWTQLAAAPVAAVALVVVLGTGSYAYASPTVNEEHALFPIKNGIEQIEMFVHRSPESAARFHARMTDRRIDEGELMLHVENVSDMHVERIENAFSQTLEHLEGVESDEPDREMLIRQMHTQHIRFEHLITTSAERRTEEVSEVDALRNVLLDFRVQISESDLTEDEKRALLNSFVDQTQE